MSTPPKQLFEAGQLAEAITAASQELREHPADTGRRGFLVELLCFAGELDRADTHLDTLSTQDPQAAMGIAQFRQLVRAEQARQQFFGEGRLPEFLQTPSEALRRYLEASICLRDERNEEAGRLLEQAENQRKRLSGTCNGEPFDDLRDLDDLTASVFEVLATNGKYYWIPFEHVTRIEFQPPARTRDLLWRQTHLEVSDGPAGEVFMPTIYPLCGTEEDRLRLGRRTEWEGDAGGPVRGRGQRTFLIGGNDLTILEIQQLTITGEAARSSVDGDA